MNIEEQQLWNLFQ